MTIDIDRPIFIVGVPRSGTTVFYRCLAKHPDLAWISPATRKYARYYWPCRIRQIFRNRRLPVEGSRVWRKYVNGPDDVLTASDVTPEQTRYYHEVVRNQIRLAGKPRFLIKHPRIGLRLGYYDAIFPDAVFIHLIRDGHAVAESILRRRRRDASKNKWWDVRPPGWPAQMSRPAAEQVGWQWDQCIRIIRQTARNLPADRYIEIRYEDFCSTPVDALRRITDTCGLAWPADGIPGLDHIRSQNEKWRSVLTTEQIQAVEAAAEDTLRELGYLY